MKAWVCDQYKIPYEIEYRDIAVPVPGPEDVQIAVHAAGIAFGETVILEGHYQSTPRLPYTVGNECSGVVMSVGENVTQVAAGDRVVVIGFTLAGGAFAEVMCAPQSHVFKIPDSLGFEEAAVVPINYYTSYVALLRRGLLQKGETLVVHGACGGVGLAAVQLGKHLGAHVIATGSSDERLAVVKALGADHVVNTHCDLREALKELTGGRGADVFLDPVGGELFDISMRAIAPGGRILVVGATSGHYNAPRTNVMLVKNISVVGIDAGKYRLLAGAGDMFDVLDIVGSGAVRPYYGARFPLDRADEAFVRLAERSIVGKCILVNDAPIA